MPTISQLPSASAATDSDEILINQNGATKKVSRSVLLSGVQPAIAAPSGSLLGRASKTSGAPEPIALGSNLILSAGTLSASGGGFTVADQTGGLVPSGGDLVAMSQDGRNVSVTYQQFLNGIAGATNMDVSKAVVTPTGSTGAILLADGLASALPRSGGTMTGRLTLSLSPSSAQEATTKGYVDTQVGLAVPKTGGTMTGTLTLAAIPSQPMQAATKSYADSVGAAAVPLTGGTMSGTLVLNGDPTAALGAATRQFVENRLARTGDTMTGALTLAGDPTNANHAATKRYVDAQIASGVSASSGTVSGALLLSGDPVAPLQAAPKQYVDARVSRAGDTLTGTLVLAAPPSVTLGAATKGYVDTAVAGAVPRTGGTLTGALGLAADPTAATDAATKRYVDTRTALAVPAAGGTMTGPLTLAGAPTAGTHAATKDYVDGVAASAGGIGGTITGQLVLSSAPTLPSHVVNKAYVDANPGRDGDINVALPPYNAKLDGTTDDTTAFKNAYLAATEGAAIIVPNGTTVLQPATTWGVPLTKRVKWIVNGTKLASGASLADTIPTGTVPTSVALPGVVVGYGAMGATVSQAQSQTTDLAALHTSYIVNHSNGNASVISNARSDTIIYNSPANFVWSGLDRLVWAGTSTPNSSAPAQHVGRYVQTVRQVAANASTGKAYAQPELWAACLEYRDATGQPSSVTGASLTVEMDWVGNGADDAKARAIQALVIAQHDPAGAPVEVATVMGVSLAAGSQGQVQKVFAVGTPFATAILDTTNSTQLSGANAIRLAAGHSIAFEATGGSKLAYDSSSGTLRWYQGGQSWPVGKGISVGWQNVATTNTTLGSYLAGNIVFLAGTGAYTISLPPARTVAAGTGFTFSVLANGSPAIAPASGDLIDAGPITLRQHDRYHIVSDGVSTWREIFRSNGISPKYFAPPVLPQYSVAGLPGGVEAGAKAYAWNGRKPSEAAGAGSGVEVFYDGIRWVSVCSGTQVTA